MMATLPDPAEEVGEVKDQSLLQEYGGHVGHLDTAREPVHGKVGE